MPLVVNSTQGVTDLMGNAWRTHKKSFRAVRKALSNALSFLTRYLANKRHTQQLDENCFVYQII